MEEPSLVTAMRDPFRLLASQKKEIYKKKTAPPRGPLLSKLIQMPERNTNN